MDKSITRAQRGALPTHEYVAAREMLLHIYEEQAEDDSDTEDEDSSSSDDDDDVDMLDLAVHQTMTLVCLPSQAKWRPSSACTTRRMGSM